MSRKLQIIIAWMGVAAVIAGAYHESLGLPPWFEDFAIFGVVPAVLILVLLLRRGDGRSDSDAVDSASKLQRLWDHKSNRIWFAVVILGVLAIGSLLVPPSSHTSLRNGVVISSFTVALGVAVVLIAVRSRRR
jgi:uncharacterized membrane protein YesL